MATFDVRNVKDGVINEIIVADKSSHYVTVTSLCVMGGGKVELHDDDQSECIGIIVSKADAQHLIAGIQKAIELGWFDK